MKLAFICRGKSDSGNGQPLQYLENSCNAVEKILIQHNWQCENVELKKLDDYANILQTNTDKEEISELIFYFIGHGDFNPILDFHILLENETTKPYIEHIINKTKKSCNNRLPFKMAIVIDSCYSGKIIDSKIITKKLYKHIEILTSSSDEEKSYESSSLEGGRTVFSHYFCKAIENDNLKFSDIKKYIYSKTKNIVINKGTNDENTVSQRPYHIPAQERDEIIIGHNKEINELVNFLKENHTLKALKEKLLTYYPRRASNHNKIRHADNFNELMNILLNERKYLKCILKEFGVDSSIVNEYATVDCQELKQKASQENKIDKLIIKVEESTDKGLDSATISGYYGYTSGGYSPTKTVSDLDLSGKKSLIEIPKYIDEVLIGKKARTIELQLILPDVLLPLDYQTEEMNSRFVLLKRLVRRLNNHHLLNIEDEIDYWEENSQLIQELKDNIVEKHIDNRGCVSLYNKDEKNIAMLYNESLSSQIKEVYDWGVPILFYPHSSYEMLDKLELNGCVVANFKNKMSAFMTNEFLEDNATHFIYDDYYDVDFLPKTDI